MTSCFFVCVLYQNVATTMFVNVLNGQRMENVKGKKFTWKLSAEEAVAFVEGHYLFFFTLSIILWKLNKMSTGNSQNAKQRLIILCTTKSLTIIDLTCAIDFTPSPHKKKKKERKKKTARESFANPLLRLRFTY